MAFSTINKGSLYQNTVLYTGDGSSQSITGVGFQPDMTWFKCRSAAHEHQLYDAVRGVTKRIVPNDTSAEGTQANGLTAFGADGFTVDDANGTGGDTQTYASWNWKAGTTSVPSGGSITPSAVSINTTSGFGIYKYTGTGSAGTIAHGLGAIPEMVITKGLDSASKRWSVGHQGIAWTHELFLETDEAKGVTSGAWNDTNPTDTLITLGTGGNGNSSGVNYIMYAWTPISGYSKFGSYIGNGNADGTFIFTGFKPAFVMIKHTNGTSNWTINDTGRDPTNVNNLRLFPNQNVAESSGSDSMDMLSNGFKLRSTDGGNNGSGDSYIYMAFGQSLVGSNNVPCTAR